MQKPSYYHRLEADYVSRIEIWWLRENGWLNPSRPKLSRVSWGEDKNESSMQLGSWLKEGGVERLRFTYMTRNEEFDYFVYLTTTFCNYGGVRYWFKCLFCDRRVGVLYLRGSYFACRHCQYLTYVSRNLSGRQKWAGKIISIPDVEKCRKAVKRKYYNGKMTRKYKRYLRIEQKARTAYKLNVMFNC